MIFRALVLACLVLVANWSHAAVIAEYLFDGSTIASSDANPDSTASDFAVFTATPSFVAGNPATGLGYQGRGTYSGPSGAASINNDYFSFTVTAAVAGGMDLTSLTLDVQGGSPDAAAFDLRSSTDGFFNVIASRPVTATWASVTPINLTAFQDLTTIEFRLYGASAGNGNSRDFRVDNVVLDGVVTPIPEPINVALALFGIAVTGMAVRRQVAARKNS